MDLEPVGFFLRRFFYACCITLHVKFGRVDGFDSAAYESVEREAQEVLDICALLQGSDVVRLDFVARIPPVVKDKLPT